MTIERIEKELRDGLEKATEGPWALAVGRAGELFIIQRGATELDDVPISGCFERDEDADYLSSCSPNNIRALLSEMERLREALERVETIAKDRSEKAWYRLDMIADEAHYAAASRALSTPSNKEGGDHG